MSFNLAEERSSNVVYVQVCHPLSSTLEVQKRNINDLIGVDYSVYQHPVQDGNYITGTPTNMSAEQVKNGSTSHKGMKLKSYSIEFKLDVVAFAETHSIHAAEREFHVDRKSIRTWKNSKEKLLELRCNAANGSQRKRLNGGGRKVHDNYMERVLLEWIYGKVKEGHMVKGTMIITKALEIQKEKHTATYQNNENKQLNFSRGWLDKFISRNNLYFVVHGSNQSVDSISFPQSSPRVQPIENLHTCKQGLTDIPTSENSYNLKLVEDIKPNVHYQTVRGNDQVSYHSARLSTGLDSNYTMKMLVPPMSTLTNDRIDPNDTRKLCEFHKTKETVKHNSSIFLRDPNRDPGYVKRDASYLRENVERNSNRWNLNSGNILSIKEQANHGSHPVSIFSEVIASGADQIDQPPVYILDD